MYLNREVIELTDKVVMALIDTIILITSQVSRDIRVHLLHEAFMLIQGRFMAEMLKQREEERKEKLNG